MWTIKTSYELLKQWKFQSNVTKSWSGGEGFLPSLLFTHQLFLQASSLPTPKILQPSRGHKEELMK
jgi:hypothetical protein